MGGIVSNLNKGNVIFQPEIHKIILGILVPDDIDFSSDFWPVTDDQGLYQSYKVSGSWYNHWQRNKPGLAAIMAGFAFNRDRSVIPNKEKLDETIPVQKPFWIDHPEKLHSEQIRVTWIGHASVLAEVDGSVILTDPIFSRRCSPVQWAGAKRYRRPACTIEELPKIDAVVISHTHYDHLDYNSVLALNTKFGTNLQWFVPSGSKDWFEHCGIQSDSIHDMVWWQTVQMSDGTTIVYTPANHWSKRTLTDTNKALWGSWLVIGKNGSKFWFGGDTAYSDVFKQIGDKYGPMDISAIPIGNYNPRETMKFLHANPQEALKIHQDLKSKLSFGIHWGTFKMMSGEPYLEPKEKTLELVSKNPQLAPFLVPTIGQSVCSIN